VRRTEDLFRLSALGLDWDIGVRVYEPQPRTTIRARRRRKAVRHLFCCMAAPGDFKSNGKVRAPLRGEVRLQGRHHDVPGEALSRRSEPRLARDTIRPDGTVRTPIWHHGEYVTPDQYVLVQRHRQSA
jgi:hypothetical protein